MREDVVGSAKDLEKRYKTLEADLLRTQQDLLASERARKDLQSEKEEMTEEMQTAARYCYVCISCCHFFLINHCLTEAQ